MASTTRRRVLLGGITLGVSAASHPTHGREHADAALIALGTELDRITRRVRRLRARVRPGGASAARSQWSEAVAACEALCERIAKEPVNGLAGLAMRYRALLLELTEDDLIVDRALRRRAVAFGRELNALARR